MCLTAPALVISRDGDEAVVEFGGRRRRASALLVPDLRPGDRCLVGLGTVLARLTEAEATQLASDLAAIEQDPGRVP
jgi:hydrogenase assembly chaperone HypC/HupF